MNSDHPADDGQAVRDLVARFSDAVNRRDPAAAGALFAEDGTWHVPGMDVQHGPDAVAAQLQGLLDGMTSLVQLVHSGTVDVDGDRASARWYLSEHGVTTDGTPVTFVGCYDDVAERGAGAWRFAERRFAFLQRAFPTTHASA